MSFCNSLEVLSHFLWQVYKRSVSYLLQIAPWTTLSWRNNNYFWLNSRVNNCPSGPKPIIAKKQLFLNVLVYVSSTIHCIRWWFRKGLRLFSLKTALACSQLLLMFKHLNNSFQLFLLPLQKRAQSEQVSFFQIKCD